MQIKKRLQINVAVSVLTALVICLVLFLSLHHLNNANISAKIAGDIITGLLERVTLRNDYMRNNSVRAKEQWFAKQEEIRGLLKTALENYQDAEDRENIAGLIADHESAGKIFSAIVINREKIGLNAGPADLSSEVEDRLLSQLNMRVYEEVQHGRKLLESSRSAREAALRLAGGGIILSLLIIIAAAMISSWTMGRAIADRIGRLREGAAMIGGGDLAHRIDIKVNDEFAELAESFNAMTAKLKESHNDFYEELALRKRAEASLNRLNDELLQRVQEQTVDIRLVNESLEQRIMERTAELEAANDTLRASRMAALNLMEDAVAARAQAERAATELQGEVAERIRAEEALRRAHDELEQRVVDRTSELLTINEQLIAEVEDRKRAEDGLIKAKEEWERTFNAITDPIMIVDTKHTILKVNGAMAEKLGVSPEEAEGMNCCRAVHDNSCPPDICPHVKLLADGEAHTAELCDEKLGGDFLVSVSPLYTPAGELFGSVHYARDITEQKKAEEAARAAFAYNRSLIEASLDPLVTIDSDGKITDVNLATEKVTGYSRPKLIGNDFSDYFTDADKARSGYEQVFSEGAVHDYALEIRHLDGHITPVLYNASVYRDESGEVAGIFAAARDITEQRKFEDKIFRLNRLYSVLSRINEAIVRIADPEELYEKACRIMVEDGLFSMAWIGLVDPETRKVIPAVSYGDSEGYLDGINIRADDLAEGRGPTGKASYEGVYSVCSDIELDPNMLPWREKALRYGFRSSAAFPLRAGGGVIGALTIYSAEPQFFNRDEIQLLSALSEDLSFAIDFMNNRHQRLQAEESLKVLNEELEARVVLRTADLEEANKELESFSYSVSHDLRAPLRHMAGFVELLQKRMEGQADATVSRYTEVIAGASKKMGNLIDDLLVFSRIGRSKIQQGKVNMNALVNAAVQEVMEGEKGRQVEWKIDKLPYVNGDQSMLGLVLVNLISNAVKFTRHCAKAKIGVGCREHNHEYVFSIKDNGVGFDMKYVDKLFGVFQRLHTQDEFEGTGIGLANVQRIISRHDGKVWAESAVGQGATFYFTLPNDKEA